MIPAKLRRMLDPGARRRMRAAARQRADALDRGDDTAADAVTAGYVAGEWARVTPLIVPDAASVRAAGRSPEDNR